MLVSGPGCPGRGDDDTTDDDDATAGEFECLLEPGGGMGDCPECIEEKCSDLVPFCEEDDACACMLLCLEQEGVGGLAGCLEQHGLAQRPPGLAPLEECVAIACPDSDECSTPPDWTPPDADVECDGLGSGGLGAGDGSDCAFDDALAYEPDGDVLQLQTASGDFCVRLERASQGPGDLANTSWQLLEVWLGPPGEVAHVDTEADLCWYSSHHNFRDWAHVWAGTRHFDLVLKEDGHGGERRYHLYAFEDGPLAGGECAPSADGVNCIEGPIVLNPYEP